ncbi:MAG: tripartite tricarboxylate transporter substrate binding protein [Casimicrobiaceae bacterium]
MWQRLKCAAILLLASFAASGAGIDSDTAYPRRAIRVIVGFPPGGSDDYIARLIGPKLTERLGQPVIVENRAGAAANIAAASVAHSPPDGYVVFIGPTSLLAASRSLYPKLDYDLLQDFEFVSLLGTGPTVLLANPALPVHSLQELVALAKAKPKGIRYGSAGIGSLAHLAMELLQLRAGIELLHVPYKGAAPNAMALTGGEIDISFAGVSSSLSMVNAKKLNALAVSGLTRVSSMPSVPTVAESGYPGFNVTNTYGVLVPAGTPPNVVKVLNAELGALLQTDDVKAKFAMQGIDAAGATPAAYRALTDAEATQWARVVKESHISTE